MSNSFSIFSSSSSIRRTQPADSSTSLNITSNIAPASATTYGCTYCDKTFSTHQALGGHQRAHKEQREAEKRQAETHYQGINPQNKRRREEYATQAATASAALTPLRPAAGSSLNLPPPASQRGHAIRSSRFFEVPDLLGPSVAPTAPLPGGASSGPAIGHEEENAVDLDLKL
ncbi:hypothetical protein DCAR_0830641 [Daucus carota subsp. sativus]|uniref:C2H2-type domain-containing protein n=1 Tax=Daucus carota subsp. sativus TaxID=79200 RepID=A0AAF0XQ19_DAUCS|nr:PREDICTED: zinc finger protein 4-like [Daucus carota subsp. sativus]WOH11162.1 hypothetical protein DCAR_0830641 [Daucus carota subsp. sativus]